MKLILQHIGPLDEAQLTLQKLTVLYGPNGAGKTTVARALGFVIRILRGGETTSAEALALISRGAEAGKISLDDYEVELERMSRSTVFVKIIETKIIKASEKIIKASGVLYEREVSGINATGLDKQPSVDVLLRVRLGDVVVVDGETKTLPLIELASPSIVTQWGAEWKSAEGMDEYAEYMGG